MALLNLTEATIRRNAPGDSFERGVEYYRDGAVNSLFRRGDTLNAQVQLTEPEPCRVQCTFDIAGIRNAICSCHDTYGGWCKHIVAALLAVTTGDAFEDRLTLEARLQDLDREQLEGVIRHLAARDPDLLRAVEEELAASATATAGSATPAPPRPASVDLDAVRRDAGAAFRYRPPSRSSWSSYHVGSQTSDLLQQAWSFIHAGDGRTALDILNAMTDTYFDEIEQVLMWDEEGESLDFIQNELGPVWTEAILSADLTPSERDGWTSKLDAWSARLEEYADGEAFEPGLRALEQWWDDPDLQRILQGERTEPDVFIESYARQMLGRLTSARLNVLERSGRVDEFLNLARAEGQVARYTTMLARQGRAEDAANYGLAHLTETRDALDLAETLREAGDLERALQIAEHGLTLEGKKTPLGSWLADLAAGRRNEWNDYRDSLLEEHHRKHKLIPMLRALG